MPDASIADLTVDELRDLIKEVVTQTILELFGDPDEGLELREEVKERLHRSLGATQTNGETQPVQDVAAKLGLEWQEFFRIGDALASTDTPESPTLTATVLAMRR
jgi:hypothetical protein